ncbi:MAG: AbrB/MazE/SpoVT family DNA-binding domain-containing protein [Sulfurovum sp.]|nr:AbrB/MazE/SpoVT family DNA-binding domain-containing protein [Sulfurovum sp.]NNJ45953.1 AbrB/MazE/SpoVT family DNA-binding domain-containing protein [Sulfurovum sp.]
MKNALCLCFLPISISVSFSLPQQPTELLQINSNGQITIPKYIRQKAKLIKGSELNFDIREDGAIIAKPINKSLSSLKGIIHHRKKKPVSIEEMNTSPKTTPHLTKNFI